jgi:hypothetical protein
MHTYCVMNGLAHVLSDMAMHRFCIMYGPAQTFSVSLVLLARSSLSVVENAP